MLDARSTLPLSSTLVPGAGKPKYAEHIQSSSSSGVCTSQNSVADRSKDNISWTSNKYRAEIDKIDNTVDDPLLTRDSRYSTQRSFSIDFIGKILKSKQKELKVKEIKEAITKGEDITPNLFAWFHSIILVLNDFSAGCLSFKAVVDYNVRREYNKFESFLQVLEVYGSGYDDDIDNKDYKVRD